MLYRSDRFAEAILDTAHEPLVCVDDDLRVVAASSPFFDHFHLARKQVLGARLPHLAEGRWNIHELRMLVEKARAGSGVQRARLQADLGFGIRDLVVNARVFKADDRAARLVLLAFDDITEHVSAETQCAHLAKVVHFSVDSIVSWGLDGNITTWNQGAERLYGYSASEMIGRSIALLMPEDSPAEFADLLRRIRDGEALDAIETVRRRKDGRLVHVSLSLAAMRDEGGAIVGATGISRDITARVAIEHALNRTVNRLQAVISNVPMLLWVLDCDGRILLSEGRLLKKLGLKAGELVGRNQFELYKRARRCAGAADARAARRAGALYIRAAGRDLRELVHPDQRSRCHTAGRHRRRPRRDRAGATGGTGPAGAENGSGGPARRRHRARFQQPPDRYSGYAELAIEHLPAGRTRCSKDIEQIHKAGLSALRA